MRFGLIFDFFIGTFEIDEYRKLILKDTASCTNCLFRIDGAIGLDVDDQLVEVGALLYPRCLDTVDNLAYR